jgi:hypothetical protein
MLTPAEKTPDSIPPCSDASGQSVALNSFLCQQFAAAGLEAVAEKVAGGHDLELDDALVLSGASLPILAKVVQLRPVNGSFDSAPTALPIERVAALPESPRRTGQPLADWESFCRTLIATRSEVPPDGAAIFWYPIVGQPLDRDLGCDGGYTGAEILRAVALARLLLPAGIEVLAPLATLGPKLAQVALEFGASHLGYVALDGQAPDDPLVADPSLLDELLGSCQRTLFREESTVPA